MKHQKLFVKEIAKNVRIENLDLPKEYKFKKGMRV